jgi:hypothetical protein
MLCFTIRLNTYAGVESSGLPQACCLPCYALALALGLHVHASVTCTRAFEPSVMETKEQYGGEGRRSQRFWLKNRFRVQLCINKEIGERSDQGKSAWSSPKMSEPSDVACDRGSGRAGVSASSAPSQFMLTCVRDTARTISGCGDGGSTGDTNTSSSGPSPASVWDVCVAASEVRLRTIIASASHSGRTGFIADLRQQ